MAEDEPGSPSELPPIDPAAEPILPLRPVFTLRVVPDFVPGARLEPLPTDLPEPERAILPESTAPSTSTDVTAPNPRRIQHYTPWGEALDLAENFPLGCIFQVIHHKPKDNQHVGARLDPRSEILSARGTQYVHSKGRKMIVVAQYIESCVCIPIYTHGGTGLLTKFGAYKEELNAIRDAGDPNNTRTESTHAPLIATRPDRDADYDPDDFTHFSPKCYAQFTRPYTLPYGSEATWAGDLLNDADVKRLQKLVCGWCPGTEVTVIDDFPILGGTTTVAASTAPVPIRAPEAPITRPNRAPGTGIKGKGRTKYTPLPL